MIRSVVWKTDIVQCAFISDCVNPLVPWLKII